jgi:hypothetical protein
MEPSTRGLDMLSSDNATAGQPTRLSSPILKIHKCAFILTLFQGTVLNRLTDGNEVGNLIHQPRSTHQK